VDSNYQGKGFGKKLFQTLLDYIMESRNDIFRVELIARESNIKAIKLYEHLGFKIEGRLVNRIKNNDNFFEADIPMAWFNPNFKQQQTTNG
jgi:ribosomal protein S18 acetylase RimI-like enzyme